MTLNRIKTHQLLVKEYIHFADISKRFGFMKKKNYTNTILQEFFFFWNRKCYKNGCIDKSHLAQYVLVLLAQLFCPILKQMDDFLIAKELCRIPQASPGEKEDQVFEKYRKHFETLQRATRTS